MKGSIRRKGKTWSYRVYVSTVDGQNKFDDVLPPPDPRHVGEIKVYTPDELSVMYKRLESTNVRIPFYIALNTGLRESECMGLR